MDRVPKDEKKTIYEIYRACRLCGAGAGYKMPIIQSVVDFESHGLELRQKIKECIQIEVNHTDRMPPLICELCVDKVNDFYDFLTLCQQTNKRTRQRLGLPLQTKSKDSTHCENCISGVMERINTESDVECVSGQRSKKASVKKETVGHVKIKIETKQEVSKLVASQKKDTMLRDMAEKAKKEVGMLRNEGGLLKKEGSMLTENAKRGSKHALEDIQLATLQDKKIKVMKSKYKKVQKEKENGRAALSSRSSTPDGQWERRRRSPASKRSTRQNTESISSDVLVVDDAPLPDARSRLKRPREKEVKIESPPPTKRVKLPESKPKETPKPGPKSKKPTKEPEPPKPVTKEPEPPKPTSKPKPASKKETKPSPPTSKQSRTKSKAEPVKTRPEPVKTKPEEPVKPKPAPKPVETKFTCVVCEHQVKTHQGLLQHNVTKHSPTFTTAKFACNACELWFPTAEECAAHHRTHRDGLPYKCHRCYGYFKLQQEYESHFAEKLCLSVYEVPDVQCWRCCHRFATSALLSAHRCPGEDGRPGGKCSKCSRSYALLKNQLKHEASCTYKKKGEVSIDPDVESRLLPMQVKVARCDALLSGPRVDVAAISHKYGLDRKARYPYLSARINGRMLQANHMVTIDDSVKAEYWGSDSNDSQKVDTLSSMTLKTINQVDKGDDNDDLTKKIFSIIDNLGADDGQTSCDSDNLLEKLGDNKQSDGESKGEQDTVSDGNDDPQGGSDSILDKTHGKSEDSSRVNDDSDKMEVVKDIPESIVSGEERVNCAVADVKSDETNVDSNSVDVNADADKMDVDAEKVDDSPEKSEASSALIKDSEKMDVDCEKSGGTTQNVDVSSAKSNDKLTTELDQRLSSSEDKTVDDNEHRNKETDVNEKKDDPKSSKDDNDIAKYDTNKIYNDDLKTSEDIDMTSKNYSINEQISIETSQSKEEKANDEENSNETQHFSSVIDNCSKNDSIDSSNQATQDCSLDYNKDKRESDNQELVKVHKTKIIDVNQEESYPPLINNEIFSKIDEITNKILKETVTSHDNSGDEHSAIEKTQKSDNHSDSISFNSLKSVNDIELQDKFNVDDLSDDDKKLMAELDAQIGESNVNHHDNDDVTSNHQNQVNDQKTSENDGGMISENNLNDNAGVNDTSVVNDTAAALTDSNQGCTDKNISHVNSNNQNGPSNNQINGNGSNDQRRDTDQKSKDYLIDNLLRKPDDLKSLELDCISDDEFNFDA